MTLDIYADVDPDAKQAAVGKIDKEFETAYAEEAVEVITQSGDVASSKSGKMVDSPLLAQGVVKQYNPALDLLMSEGSEDMPPEALKYLLQKAKSISSK